MSWVFSSSGCAATYRTLPSSRKPRSSRNVSWAVIGSAARPPEIGPASRAPARTKGTSRATGRFDPWERRGADMAQAPELGSPSRPHCGAAMEIRRQRAAFRPHFFTVNGTEYCVFSHIILSTPPPLASGSIAIVNWSTVLSRVDFLRSTRASSLAFSESSL